MNVTAQQPWTNVSPADDNHGGPGYLTRNKVTCSDPEVGGLTTFQILSGPGFEQYKGVQREEGCLYLQVKGSWVAESWKGTLRAMQVEPRGSPPLREPDGTQ